MPPHHLVELALKLLDLVRQLPRVTAPKHGETGNERSTHRARGKRRLGSFIACAAVALPLERIIHVLLLRHIADIAAIVCCAEESMMCQCDSERAGAKPTTTTMGPIIERALY